MFTGRDLRHAPPSSFRSCAKRRWSATRSQSFRAPGPEEEGAERGQHRTKREIIRADNEPCASLVQSPCRLASPSAVLPWMKTSDYTCRGGRPRPPEKRRIVPQAHPLILPGLDPSVASRRLPLRKGAVHKSRSREPRERAGANPGQKYH